MSGRIDVLAWDTDFFGVRIGRADLNDLSDEDLDALDAEARDAEVACLVGDLDPHRSDAALRVQAHGHRLVEVGILYARPAGPFAVPETEARARLGTVEDLPALGPCIDVLAPWSRFAVDPRFGEVAARRLFAAWAERAATDTTGRFSLAVAETDAGIVGFSTHTSSPLPRVDLMGVLQKGSGASWALMEVGLGWADDDGAFEAGPCAARNLAPLRFLEHCGFHADRTRYVFHRWYD